MVIVELHDLGIPYDDMKRIIIEAISQNEFSQFGNVKNYVADYAKNHLNISETNRWLIGSSQSYTTLNDHDSNLVRQIV